MKQKIYLRIQTSERSALEVFLRKIKKVVQSNNFSYSSISLPMRKTVYTVLKSPHVNKRAKDQFEIRLYNQLVILYTPVFTAVDLQQIRQCFSPKILVKLSFLNSPLCSS